MDKFLQKTPLRFPLKLHCSHVPLNAGIRLGTVHSVISSCDCPRTCAKLGGSAHGAPRLRGAASAPGPQPVLHAAALKLHLFRVVCTSKHRKVPYTHGMKDKSGEKTKMVHLTRARATDGDCGRQVAPRGSASLHRCGPCKPCARRLHPVSGTTQDSVKHERE